MGGWYTDLSNLLFSLIYLNWVGREKKNGTHTRSLLSWQWAKIQTTLWSWLEWCVWHSSEASEERKKKSFEIFSRIKLSATWTQKKNRRNSEKWCEKWNEKFSVECFENFYALAYLVDSFTSKRRRPEREKEVARVDAKAERIGAAPTMAAVIKPWLLMVNSFP